MYMAYAKAAMLATKKSGTSHGNHDLGGGGHGRGGGRAASISPGVLLFPIEEGCVRHACSGHRRYRCYCAPVVKGEERKEDTKAECVIWPRLAGNEGV